MRLKFTKIQGCGNDYIFFDCFNQEIKNPSKLSKKLSNRHYGIGGDGIVLIKPSKIANAKMIMFNSDGSQGDMCGTGVRCIAKYLFDEQAPNQKNKNDFAIEVGGSGRVVDVKRLATSPESFYVDMGKANFEREKIPVDLNLDRVISFPLDVFGRKIPITCVSMGNPHCVIFCENVIDVNMEKIGKFIENHKIFPNRTNVEFAEILGEKIKMRVWERGSGETLSCGTGACACAAAAVENGHFPIGNEIPIELRGGELKVKVTKESVYISGEARKVFEGFVEI
ncbi:MAG: diaminopimelate epimerase [Oscillospiraceae bacterium]|jgi:diaminopimelate epimerase|nr:diaminopimelate epimerase [Oscillospiraceae bacterium]